MSRPKTGDGRSSGKKIKASALIWWLPRKDKPAGTGALSGKTRKGWFGTGGK